MNETSHIILAIDNKDLDEIVSLSQTLKDHVYAIKLNDALARYGISIIEKLHQNDIRIMADPKYLDIPATMEHYAMLYRDSPPWLVTVHATNTTKALTSFSQNIPKATNVIGVTILSSMSIDECQKLYKEKPAPTVEKLTSHAHDAGIQNFVCSPQEVSFLRKKYPHALLITPGVRSASAEHDDQARVTTPRDAIQHGADYVVIGREIVGAKDPKKEAARINREIAELKE